jgi:trk/ktr system potassium uptake protein
VRILIIGAGEVGGHLAHLLSRENHDITIVDKDPHLIADIGNNLDVLAIEGHGTSPTVLKEAGIENADMLIAVTTVDEVNILSCMIAKQFGVKTKIARVRNHEFSLESSIINPTDLGIDLIIHPELEATKEISRLIRFPQVQEMITFCNDEIAIVGIKVPENSPIIGMELPDVVKKEGSFSFRFVAISRNGDTIIPRGTDRLEKDDNLYISCRKSKLNDIFKLIGHKKKKTNNVMIYGASLIGRMVAEELDKDKKIHVKLLENELKIGKEVLENLEHTEVLIGDASDINLITSEGIIDMDVFAALSDDDEDNIVTSLLTRHLKVPKTITLIGKSTYIPIVKAIGLDIAINPRLLTSNAILKFIRLDKIISLRHMVGINAETYEFKASPGSKVVGKTLTDIPFPEGSIVAAVEHHDSSEIPVGNTHIFVGDRVVVFCIPSVVKGVLKLFE